MLFRSDRGADQSRNQGYDPLHSCRCSGRRRRLHRQRQAVPPPGAVRPVLLIERLIASLDVFTVRIEEPIRTVLYIAFESGCLVCLRLLRGIPACRFEKRRLRGPARSLRISGGVRSFALCPIRGSPVGFLFLFPNNVERLSYKTGRSRKFSHRFSWIQPFGPGRFRVSIRKRSPNFL